MDWIKLRKEYESSEISLKDLAVKYGVSEGTMRSRKNREKWQRNAMHDATQRKEQRATGKKNVATRDTTSKREPKIRIVVNNRKIEIEENTELTEKQSLFCLYYVKYWSATKAYQKAYGCGYNTANVEGFKHLVKPSIKKEIDRLKQNIREGIGLEVMAVLQKYIDIAFADIGDYVSFGQRDVPVMNMFGPVYEGKGNDKKAVLKTINFVDIRPNTEIDGTLISEIKQGKDGVSIKLQDKMKALEKLDQYLDLLPDKHKRRIDEEKIKLDKAKFDIDKAKATGSTGIDANNERILTLAKLLNNPVPNRNTEDFEDDDDDLPVVGDTTVGGDEPQ